MIVALVRSGAPWWRAGRVVADFKTKKRRPKAPSVKLGSVLFEFGFRHVGQFFDGIQEGKRQPRLVIVRQ